MTKSYKTTYSEIASHTLAGFQLIEQSLKEYLTYYYSTLEIILDEKLPFKYNPKEFEEAPLGRLCSLFTKCNDNEDLQNKIKHHKEHRNQLAHRALTLQFDSNITEKTYKEETYKFIKVSKESGELLDALFKEKIKLLKINSEHNKNG